jgi:hypothetical protein
MIQSSGLIRFFSAIFLQAFFQPYILIARAYRGGMEFRRKSQGAQQAKINKDIKELLLKCQCGGKKAAGPYGRVVTRRPITSR